MVSTTTSEPGPSARLEELVNSGSRIEELSSASEDADDVEYEDEDENPSEEEKDMDPVHSWLPSKQGTAVPSIYTRLPFLQDEHDTDSSEAQQRTAEMVRKMMSGEERQIKELNSHGIPKLLRRKHVKFLKEQLGAYPAPFQAMDASRPWIWYWALSALAALGEDLSVYKDRAIQTITPVQNPTGGFGGGHGQLSHLAPSYATTLSLAMVDGLHVIDRKTMWQWLGSVKQPDGGFQMTVGGEEDVRGAYCAMTIISLLNLPLDLPPDSPANITGQETFLTNLGEWLGKCQTYEGGIGEAPDNEAHGAHAFCCLACLSIMDAPHRSIPKYLNVDSLLSWLSARQFAPEGSFSGRTNKLVDACYSHWVGGCWALVEAALSGPQSSPGTTTSLWNREALIRYTLCCSQTAKGGLRDKPGTRVDGYHSCYSLAGLSAAQNHWTYQEPETRMTNGKSAAIGDETEDVSGLPAPFKWAPQRASAEERQLWAFDEEDAVGLVHPVYVIPPAVVERVREQYGHSVGFRSVR